jgi:cytochrome P450
MNEPLLTVAVLVALPALVASLPYWLPGLIVGLRVRIFARINGDEGLTLPGKLVDPKQFKQVYADPAANGRSRGAALSDLFWYWLSPGAELHQEHLEPGPAYDEVARTTRRILALPKPAAQALTTRCVARVLGERSARAVDVVRLRDLMMPIWADFYYELVFGEPCPPEARRLIVGNADDVITALKCTGLRHMAVRDRLTRYLVERVKADEVPHQLPAHLSTEQRALYLQGTFFNTAVVQMSEAMTHLVLVVAQHPEVQARLVAEPDDDHYLDRVINETLRLYPLFGIAHRITSGDIEVDADTTIPAGAVLCFNYPEYHRTGYADPERFDPDRWERLSVRDAHHIPFGVSANRPCPAQGLAPVTMRAALRELLRHVAVASSVSHTRSIPHRGPCLLLPRDGRPVPGLRPALLGGLRLRDRWEDVSRSVVQLMLGTYMVWDARRLKLCTRHFEQVQ